MRTAFRAVDLFVQRTDDADKRGNLEAITWDTRKRDTAFMELRGVANENLSAVNRRLATENEQLRHTVQSLRQAHVILTDELGTYTSPSIPDN